MLHSVVGFSLMQHAAVLGIAHIIKIAALASRDEMEGQRICLQSIMGQYTHAVTQSMQWEVFSLINVRAVYEQ